MTPDQVLVGAIVASILILIVVGVSARHLAGAAPTRTHFGAGGREPVPLGTLGVAKTDLAPSGVVLAAGEQWTANSASGMRIDAGRGPRRGPGWPDASSSMQSRLPKQSESRSPRMEIVAIALVPSCSSSSWRCSVLPRASRSSTSTSGLLIFTLGRTSPQEVKGPGWVFVVPIVQRGIRVDLREQFIEVPSQTGITKDNAPISIDFLIYWRIADPYKSVVEVQNFNGALQNIATTTLRAVVGDILLDDVLSKREQINEVLRIKLDEVTERWGGKVTTVEIREITPPRDVQDAMNRQLSAERTRRAVITESEGSRQSAINVAEGTKQAEILRAEGDRQAAILRAEGFSLALERIYQAASQVDQKTMALQYLDAFKALGQSPATKYLIPLEFTQLADSFRGYLVGANEPEPAPDAGAAAPGG